MAPRISLPISVTEPFGALMRRLQPGWQAAYELSRPALARFQAVTGTLTRLGWSLLVIGFLCWLVGWLCGWTEVMVLATASWLLLAICALLTIGRTKLRVVLTADPQRVVVGSPAAGSITVTNVAHGPLLPIGLELPIGAGAARFTLPLLRPNSPHEELFVVPTGRRGVITVGPARTVRGDPFGFLGRSVSWTEALEIFVHPITVNLESFGAGLVRDLEGVVTSDLSASDLAFHALRDYQPGDDRRHVHWRSSAKAGKLLVRQFLDTRRSHVCVVVDSAADSYPDLEDFELAVSAAASISIRAVKDEQETSVLIGDHAAPRAAGSRVLDVYSRAELGSHGLHDLSRRAARIVPDASMAVLITGSHTRFVDLRRAASNFPIEVRVIALQIDPDRPTGLRQAPGMAFLSLQRLGDLASLLMSGAQ